MKSFRTFFLMFFTLVACSITIAQTPTTLSPEEVNRTLTGNNTEVQALSTALTQVQQNLLAAATEPQLPPNVAAAGLGFQSAASPQTSGWAEVCRRNPDIAFLGLTVPSYLCAATDYSGDVSSARVDMHTVLLAKKWFAGGAKTGAGAAVNNAGMGGSYALGAWASADISKWVRIEDVHLVFSVTWSKDDVAVAARSGPIPDVLRSLGSRACFRFGLGKAFGKA